MDEITKMNDSTKANPPHPYGYLPNMALGSKGTIGGLLASSFCERINSAANLVVTNGNSLLGTDEINMLVTLRMNRDFMQFMKRLYAIPDHLFDGA